MHSYAIESEERVRINAGLAFLSVVAAWLLNTHFSFPWWVDAPSVWGFFGILYALFNCYLWKTPLLRATRIVSTPDLNGEWRGSGTSSYDDHQTARNFVLEVRQTWTRMNAVLTHGTSVSHSTVGAIVDGPDGCPILVYEYWNEPSPDAVGSMHIHRGLTRLTFRHEDGKDVLEGDYYTGRDRQTIGRLRFERQSASTQP